MAVAICGLDKEGSTHAWTAHGGVRVTNDPMVILTGESPVLGDITA